MVNNVAVDVKSLILKTVRVDLLIKDYNCTHKIAVLPFEKTQIND